MKFHHMTISSSNGVPPSRIVRAGRDRALTRHVRKIWLVRQRVDLARHLLETTDWPVDVVAHRAGFGTGVSLRQHLHTAIGVTPQAYRRTFRPNPQPGNGRL